jgi:hypothetical protein
MKQPHAQNCVIVTIADTGFLPAACCTLISTRQGPPANMNVSRLLLAVDVQENEIAKVNGFLQTHGVEPCVTPVSTEGLLDPGFRVDGHVTRASLVRLTLDKLKNRMGPDPRNPSGPAATTLHKQAEHKTVPDLTESELKKNLAPQEPSTQDVYAKV